MNAMQQQIQQLNEQIAGAHQMRDSVQQMFDQGVLK
jgi:flagellar hook-associated protein FlgK